jgi:hypothetical protein
MKNILKYQSLERLFFGEFGRVGERHHGRGEDDDTFFLHFLLLGQLVNQVVVLVIVVVVYEVLEMVLASRSPVPVVLHVRLVVLAAQLERSLARFYYLLTDQVALCILLLYFLFALWLILLAYDSLVGRVVQQIYSKRLQLRQNVSRPWNTFIILQRFVILCVDTNFNCVTH